MTAMKSRQQDGLSDDGFADERKELETVLASGMFAVSSHAASLLRFVCEKYFEGVAEPLTEYDIAVSALGRRSSFDPRTDSIVRVEAHRVRKRLAEYYETEAAAHPVRIILPPGRYIPEFVRSSAAQAAEPARPRPAWARRWPVWSAAAIIVVGLAAGLSWRLRSPQTSTPPAGQPGENLALLQGDTVRILAGRPAGEYIDRAGTRWMADAYFTGGSSAAVRYHSLAMADDPAIYEYCRVGETFAYDIPLRPGVYEMRLMFAESAESVIVGAVGDGTRSFRVLANDVQVLPPPDDRHMRALDILVDAGGSNTADVKVVKDIRPAADGKLHLRFIGRDSRALLNAIEIVPGLKGKMRPLRWRANETPYMDRAGNLWLSDRYFRGGRLSRFRAAVSRTPDPQLYEGERFGSFSYQIPVAADGSYAVTLHFAENYFGGYAAPTSPPRIFSVYANHAALLRNFDVTREAGGTVLALVKTFRGIKPNHFDKIVLNFEPATQFAIVNAIAVEDEAK
jgi:hypothetical protein